MSASQHPTVLRGARGAVLFGAGCSCQERREQTHLVPFYALCADLVMVYDARVRTGVRSLMLALGKELGLPLALDGKLLLSQSSVESAAVLQG